MSQCDPTDWPSDADQESALNELAAEMRASAARQEAISPQQLELRSLHHHRFSSDQFDDWQRPPPPPVCLVPME